MNLSEFQSWALAQGQVGNPVDPPTYVGQCVSLVQQYLDKVFGISYQARGNAKDWATNANVLSYFDVVSSIQVGDIIDYGADYGNGVGHIGLAIGNNQILDQNGHKTLHVATGAIYPNVMAILRHKGGGSMIEPATVRSLSADFSVPLTDAQVEYYSKHPGGYTELYLDFLKYNHDIRKQLESGSTPLKPGLYKVG